MTEKQPWRVLRTHGGRKENVHLQEAPAATFQDALRIARNWADENTTWIKIQVHIDEIPQWVTVRMFDPLYMEIK